jgi:hypothetical protein
MQLCKIKNTAQPGDDNYFTIHLDFQANIYDIAPGEEVIVPFEVASSFFGHPDLFDDGRNNIRQMEYKRVRFYWGFNEARLDKLEHWKRVKPPFKVTTLDDEYVPMVLDDPQGKLPRPGDETIVQPDANASIAVLEAAVRAQQQQIEQLTALIAAQAAAQNPGVIPAAPASDSTSLPSAPTDSDSVSTDGPRTTRLRNEQGK